MDKKEMLKQLEIHFGEKPKYMGAPTFAYQLKTGDVVYTIDREGKIKNAEGTEVELGELLEVKSEVTESEDTTPKLTETTLPEADEPVDRSEVVLPMEGHTGLTLRNLINMITSKQSLIQQAFELKTVIINEELTKALNEKAIMTIEDFAALEIGTEKCPGIAFDFDLKTITFKFCEGELEPDRLKAYTDLVTAINANAQKLKHASCKPTATDNPKYSLRTWITRLGMIGPEYKTTRKIILADLEGNGAYAKQAHKKRGQA